MVLTLGSLSMDPVTRRVRRGGSDIPLTAREYGLLHYLMRRHDEVVSKAEILDNVWDSAFEGGDNVVEVYSRWPVPAVQRSMPGSITAVRCPAQMSRSAGAADLVLVMARVGHRPCLFGWSAGSSSLS